MSPVIHRSRANHALLLLSCLICTCTRRPPLKILYNQAVELREKGDIEGAISVIDENLRIAQKQSAAWYWDFSLLKVEIVEQKRGPNAALALLRQEAPAAPELGPQRARYQRDVGWAYFRRSDFPQARKTLEEGLSIAQSSHAEDWIPLLDFALAAVLQHQGMLPEAETIIREANEMARSRKNQDQTITGLDMLGLVLMDEYRFEDALPVFEQELELLTGANKASQTATALNNLAWCRYQLGEEDRALKLFERAIDLARKSQNVHVREVALGNAGNIYFNRRDFTGARQTWEEVLRIAESRSDREFEASWLADLAAAAIETKDWDLAANYAGRSLALDAQLKVKKTELYARTSLARISQGKGDTVGAERQLLDIARTPSQDHVPVLNAHRWLAQLYANEGQDANANAEFAAALKIIELRRSKLRADDIKMDFLSNLMHVHEDYVDFLMARGKTETALEVAEASRARILQERAGQAAATQTVPASVYRRIARETNSFLLSYWLGPARSYVWVTTPENTIAYTLPAREKIRLLVENYRALIENQQDPLDLDDTSGRELYEALLLPVIDRVPKPANLIIVPDGALTALNFETLPVQAPWKHYFVEDATIAVTPSLNLLNLSGQSTTASNRMLLIGDPEFSDSRYSKLPHAALEMQLIEKRFPASGVTAFQGARAVPAAYLESAGDSYRYVHFTAHASTNTENPLDSEIILAGVNGASRLTARDVLKVPIHAGLVTISACRGAGAKTYAGEGLVGFMWAFYRAGAGNVIAGLWDVSDESTPELMDSLYGRLTHGEAPATALRAAKLELLQSGTNYRLPYFWAPFQLYARHLGR